MDDINAVLLVLMKKHHRDSGFERLYGDAKAYLVQRREPRPGYERLILTHGEGVNFWDAKGKKYLDLISQLYIARESDIKNSRESDPRAPLIGASQAHLSASSSYIIK